MIVTSVIKQDKRKSLVILDEDVKISLYNNEIYGYGIQENTELSEDDRREIFEVLLPRRAKERVFYMLKDSDKSEYDVRMKLLSAYYPESIIESTIIYMKERKYIDDRRFTENFIRNHYKQKSINRIKYDLMLHGVDRSIIDEILELMKEDGNLPADEQQNIIRREFIRRRYDFYMEDEKIKNKIIMSLIRKGFDYDSINLVYRDMKDE